MTCGLLGFTRQAFYAWRAAPVSQRDLVDAYAMNAAFEVHRDDPGFGYRFIADELADAGHELSERRVWKICSQAGIVSAHSRTRGRAKKPGQPVHDDLVERDFTATGPNRLWLTDITEHPTTWIPAVVATPATRSEDAGEEVFGGAAVEVHGVDRSGWVGQGRGVVRGRAPGSGVPLDEAGGALDAEEYPA